MTYKFFIPVLIIISVFISACRTEKVKTEIELSGFNKVFILDSMSASKAIIRDDIEGFFNHITPVDMMIQMQGAPSEMNRENVLSDYKKFIQNDVVDFKPDEVEFIVKVMSEAFELCNKANFKYFPTEIKLIKTHGKHYGDDTYYTRENLIVIPKMALKKKNHDEFLKVMLHEISHIATRLNPSLKTKLYTLIGFKKLDLPLIINDSLQQRLLTNPDGHELTWATELNTAVGKNVLAIPLIYSNENTLIKEKKDFFQYLGFNYFEILPSDDQKSMVLQTIGNQQKSTLHTEGLNQLYREKFNTDYIIHPDEIVADNFSILMFSMGNPKSLSQYTEGGQLLIKKMQTALSEK
jgi:hypothetical protein